ncbi:DNA polymerase III epsilon subunit-like protein [Kineococcus xinjiangensis]|uniref:DNA polymerase III epsilon subunit-like protein n=1 Tax=Kineococcus xinjiangensis TaxID=512762 RepID=A0A2S6ICH6_9ACTN|nr:3'-5' exonuclease [Kineococcus xinjiangensis]PPK91928.1 DNA polymerase III epsilon subunit-like protein [Kineococcus xinjiangensis]
MRVLPAASVRDLGVTALAAGPLTVHIGDRTRPSGRPVLHVTGPRFPGDAVTWGAAHEENAELHEDLAADARTARDVVDLAQHTALASMRRALDAADALDVETAAPRPVAPSLASGADAARVADVLLRVVLPAYATAAPLLPARVHAALADDVALPAVRRAMHWRCAEAGRLLTARHDAHTWAREMVRPDAAVLLDLETTALDGMACEVAVLDAATGETLLDTLVRPPTPCTAAAAAVHGITTAQLADAPTLAHVWDDVLRVTRGRRVLTWNADFDHAVLTRSAAAADLPLAHLDDVDTWACLMARHRDHAMRWRYAPLRGPHRALGDCHTARRVLHDLAAPAAGAPPTRIPAPTRALEAVA